MFRFCMCSFAQEYSQFFSTAVNGRCSSCRYIYIADIMDHDIDVYERQDGEHLVYLKVMKCFFFLKQENNPHLSHLGNYIYSIARHK